MTNNEPKLVATNTPNVVVEQAHAEAEAEAQAQAKAEPEPES